MPMMLQALVTAIFLVAVGAAFTFKSRAFNEWLVKQIEPDQALSAFLLSPLNVIAYRVLGGVVLAGGMVLLALVLADSLLGFDDLIRPA